MGITYEVDAQAGVVLERWTGKITATDVAAHASGIFRNIRRGGRLYRRARGPRMDPVPKWTLGRGAPLNDVLELSRRGAVPRLRGAVVRVSPRR